MQGDKASSGAIETAPPAFALRAGVGFFGTFLAFGIMLPYFPVWLKSLSLEDWQIGLLLSLPMFVRILTTPLIAAYADRAADRAHVLILTAFLSILVTALLFVVDGFWMLLIVVLAQAIVVAPHVVIIDSITITGVRRYRTDYARVRLWGSVAFVVANVIGGYVIARQGAVAVLPLLILGQITTFGAALMVPRVGRPRRPSALASGTQAGLLANRPFVVMLIGGATIHASHAMLYGFSAIYWGQLGYSGTVIGALWATGVVAEVALFQVSRRLIGHIDVTRIIVVGGLIAALRWALFPIDLGAGWYFAMQLLHAGSFSVVFLGMQRLIVMHVGEEKEAGAQGLFFMASGATMATAMVLSGYLFDRFGGTAFVAMALLALMGIACHLAGRSMQRP